MSFDPLSASPVASVADADDRVTAVIYRHVEPIMVEADLFAEIITVQGDLDSDVAVHLEHVLRRSIARGRPVCCDLGQIGFFGAAGARVAFSASELAAATATTFLLRGVRGMTLRVLDAVGFDQSMIMK